MWTRVQGWVQSARDRLRNGVLALSVGVTVALADVAPSFAQTTSLFPVSTDVDTVKADLLLWGTALIGVALAIYAFRRVRGLVTR